MHCELGLVLERCYNIVRNALIVDMTKPRKQVFRLSDLQTAVQQKLVSTIWSLYIETYAYGMSKFVYLFMDTLDMWYVVMFYYKNIFH